MACRANERHKWLRKGIISPKTHISELLKWERFGTMIYNKWDSKTLNKSPCRHLKGIFQWIAMDWLPWVNHYLRCRKKKERGKKSVRTKVSAQSHVVPCMYMYKKPLTLLMILLQLIQGMEEKDRVVPKWEESRRNPVIPSDCRLSVGGEIFLQ